MDTLPMERCPELRESLPGPDWWRVALPLPELLFRVDFVTVDARSGAVDNNGWVAARLPVPSCHQRARPPVPSP